MLKLTTKSLAPWIALAAIAAFGWFVNYALQHIADGELQWSRIVFIFGAVEAVGLAAVGFIFGKEVNRERADKAEERSQEAEVTARTAHENQSAARQRVSDLATIIKQKAATKAGRSSLVFDELAQFAATSHADKTHPEVMNFIETARASRATAPYDSDWDELSQIAQEFARA